MKKILLVLCVLGMCKISNAQNVFPSSGPVYIGEAAVYNGFINSPEGIFLNTDYDGSGGSQIVFGTGRAGFSGGTELMRIATSGNVGIGTSTPAYKLDVSGTGNFTGAVYLGSPTVSNGFINSSEAIYLNTDHDGSNPGPIVFGTGRTGFGGGTEWMRVGANGNVGIGTASPGEKLTVTGNIAVNSGNAFKLYRPDSESPSTSWYWSMSMDANNLLNFNINGGTSKMVIDASGNVGIGTISPDSYKLAVNGNVRAKEIKVETGWSDFVFEPQYKLRSLRETEQFIKENKHLPEIPSAKEVAENGINLGEMNAKLLQKIEELTLHLIEQNKRLDAQQKEISQLKSKP